MDAYKDATICLSVLLAIFLILNICGVVVIQKEWQIATYLAESFAKAASNKNACDTVGVICEFIPETIVVPVLPVTIFSNSVAKCSAQLIGRLSTSQTQVAMGNVWGGIINNVRKTRYMGRVPLFGAGVPRGTIPNLPDNFTSIAVLNTPEDSAIGWIVSPTNVLPAQLWIVFRGTQTKQEWIQDFDWAQVSVNSSSTLILAHRGYVNIYNALKTQIQTAVNTFYTNNKDGDVIICGHSLGAGVALVCAHEFSGIVQSSRFNVHTALNHTRANTDVVKIPYVYVFAPPRTGNPAFVTSLVTKFDKNLYAIANDSDIVPTLPFAVQPNMDQGGQPWLYAQLPLIRFDTNWGSWDLNHMLPVYIKYLNSL